MSRPVKQTVEYFPHMVAHKRTMFVIETKWGNDGYAFWFKILEILGATEGHFFDCKNPKNWEFLLAKTRVNEQTAREILGTLALLEAIDKKLWEKAEIIWCQKFVDNLFAVYEKRRNKLPSRPVIDQENELSSTETPAKDDFRNGNEVLPEVSGDENPHESFRDGNSPQTGLPVSEIPIGSIGSIGSRGTREEEGEETEERKPKAAPPPASPPEVHSPLRKEKPQHIKTGSDAGVDVGALPPSAPPKPRSKPKNQQLAELAEILRTDDPAEYKKLLEKHPEFAEGPLPIDSS